MSIFFINQKKQKKNKKSLAEISFCVILVPGSRHTRLGPLITLEVLEGCYPSRVPATTRHSWGREYCSGAGVRGSAFSMWLLTHALYHAALI